MMKLHAKPTQFLLRLLLVAAMIFLSFVSTFSRLWAATSPFDTFAYDGTSDAIIAYDGGSESGVCYDVASVLSSREKKNGATWNRVFFTHFAKFLAAKGAPTAEQLANLARFEKKLPANATPTKIFDLPNGGKAFQADSASRNIPGSFAQYEKQVDAAGNTLQYTKTTFGPNGEIIHVKDKIGGGTFP